jgi:transposase-like protein
MVAKNTSIPVIGCIKVTGMATNESALRYTSHPLRPEDRTCLEHWIKASTTPQRLVLRSRIVLLSAAGSPAIAVARSLGVSRPTVRLWVRRYGQGGPQALEHDAPGRGRHATLDTGATLARLREANLLDGEGQCTNLHSAAALLGVSVTTVWRALRKAPKQADPLTPEC